MLSFIVLLALLVTILQSVVASPLHSRHDYAVKESHKAPPKWSVVGKPHPFHLLKLNIGLKPNNFGLLEQHLHEGKVLELISLVKIHQLNFTT
jgi:hypothetical protein